MGRRRHTGGLQADRQRPGVVRAAVAVEDESRGSQLDAGAMGSHERRGELRVDRLVRPDLARIATLSIRLLANMFADHTVVTVWLSLVPVAVPAVFMGLGLVIAFLQAFVFALLTMIYINMAQAEAH